MEESDPIEEEITSSNLLCLQNHNLDIRGSMGMFPEKNQMQEISAIYNNEKTQQSLYSKSSLNSVFDRLVNDTNRRINASRKIGEFKQKLETERDNSFLSQKRISKTTEYDLLNRLILDTQRRSRKYEAIENYKKSYETCSSPSRISPEKTREIVSRLSRDTRRRDVAREEVKKNIKELEISINSNMNGRLNSDFEDLNF